MIRRLRVRFVCVNMAIVLVMLCAMFATVYALTQKDVENRSRDFLRAAVEDPDRAEHLRSTFSSLLEMGVIPVVNENDSVSSAEIETGRHKVLGDNDTLSAIVAALCQADLLVLLSDIDGLYDADPKTHPGAKLLHRVEALTPEILDMAGGAGSWRGTGGMATKLSAARRAMEAGCDMVITNGKRMEDLYGIVEGQDIGTRFIAKREA